MAATLPAINMGGDLVSRSSVGQQHSAPTSAPGKLAAPGRGLPGQQRKRPQGKREREMEQRRLRLRAEQPNLTKSETTEYRNAYKHNLFVSMLQDGFHRSYIQLFELIKHQNEKREKAGPDSALWMQTLLENEPEKLDILKMYLIKGESALRKSDFQEVYLSYLQLAQHFQETGDKWLSDHFYELCLTTAFRVTTDSGRLAAEGHCNMGLALEQNASYFEAAENFEKFYHLSQINKDWTFDDGQLLHTVACNHLTRLYTIIADQHEAEGDLALYKQFLVQAYERAEEGGDIIISGEASYRLGVANEKNGDSTTALEFLQKYLDICKSLGDKGGSGKACQAIAKSYESQGKVEESIKYLEMFVEVADKSQDDQAISRACSDLGAMFNSLGRYEQAVEFFNKAYNISRTLNDTTTINSSRVLFGVAAAHKMLANVSVHVENNERTCVERLIEWKDNRGDDFQQAIPESEKARES